MIASLFPEDVIVVRATPEMEREPLHPAERAWAERLGENRRREFALGRACARRALARLGIEGFALLSGENRAPRWPPGVVGTLTHCRGFCAAAVARCGALVGLGLDAEPARPLSAPLVERITAEPERARLGALPAAPAVGWGTVLFTAKESLYKCYFPITGAFLGFRDAEIDLDPEAARFTARLCRDEKPSARGARTFHGRYHIDEALVISAVALTAAECSEPPAT
ncbi:MAG: 4'-phosphopantetheinyl transferase superfamily protein [Myxococcales bacterium]|nr:4'-phosphopantetheinyl transferase superfamily protein [Myxococcales bacterium]MDH5306978.1 4'-phosphopantetheinyl transferase superfamily protein [Myxococcales bacterium]MDH5566853.1 4'-phosphopantetheinyl transferase superfamily protein [Myxococcales bacterium]